MVSSHDMLSTEEIVMRDSPENRPSVVLVFELPVV